MFENQYKVKIEGLNINKLLDKARINDIILYNVKRDSYKELSFCIDMLSYPKLFTLPEIKEYKIETKAKKGFPYIKNIFISRLGLFIGLALAIIMVVIAQFFTFNIQIMGLEEIQEGEIVSVLKENGITVNAINKISSSEIESLLLQNIEQISMVSVAKQGTTVLINIKEKTLLETTYTAIYATNNMIITNMIVYGGTAMVQVGDIVKVGDMLVDCHTEVKGEIIECEPKAEIYADIWVAGQVKFAEHEEYYERTGKKQILRTYEIFGKQFLQNDNKTKFENYEIEENEKYLFNGWLLPIKSIQQTYHELELVTIDRDFEPERENLLAESKVLAYNQIDNQEVLEETSNVCKIGNTYYVQTFIKINKKVV